MDSQLWTVYIDGSATPNPGRMRIGGIAYAPDGSTRSFSQAIAHSGCNNEAEALAAIHALQWLNAQQVRAVLLHTDNSILAEQLSQASPKPIVRLADIYAQARALLPLFDSVQLRWIPRHKNAVADALARGEPVEGAAPQVAVPG
ncbi:ribonuclease HI family protein [Acidovorax sp. CCYZU-2555]|uniref:ribonuclease HI family protein n=1 Tax=Acidovorax sp. CCYZU-2555 TaxID=2835042 RepID=UPI001BCBA42D|nr:ribonuclease HI family protein [Acidovorax sp. CCYZU-2555]MBS7778810.1 ribonuclease HI family protein [Acidovorax sp. CCYZU-2555]